MKASGNYCTVLSRVLRGHRKHKHSLLREHSYKKQRRQGTQLETLCHHIDLFDRYCCIYA